MDYPKFIVSNQKEESIIIQRVNMLKKFAYLHLWRLNRYVSLVQAKNKYQHCCICVFITDTLGLNEIYVWNLLPTYPIFFNPTLNIKMVFGEKIPKMGTFSDFVTGFFVKC